ncbi:protease FtsH subunit HflK [Desulfobotulus alkaliphilus]|uniref:Protein HflK n=1 Tax=Desulfobotulus alkaliphilus TaxID=622671 RepID=A0A562RRW0_9BACT|nr:FtsH protease activity modulator HflK [Desulfobotulus alkaliphilus]TWI71792.1 protease FtsH subunit HflK [Desulfobotulus alkaliphilus]
MNWDWDKLRDKQQQNERRSGGGGAGKPPQVDEMVDQLKNMKIPGNMWLIVLVAIAVLMGSTMFYTVGVSEVGVVQRFGKFVRISEPGLNFKLPLGIETSTKVKVRRVYKEEFGYRENMDARSRFAGSDMENAALMLTGDLNVALVPWIVQYQIRDPYNFLFKVQDPRQLLRDLSEASMRLVVGDRSISEVISAREEIAIVAHEILQRELDKAESGIHIVTIEMKRTNVPEPVQPSFNEVNRATQEREQMIYKAMEEYNRAVPSARGEAERVIREAQGYALNRVNRAEGDAARFNSIYAEYISAKDVTERRMYLEMMRELLPTLENKYIIDSDQGNVLPFLNLGKEFGVKQ